MVARSWARARRDPRNVAKEALGKPPARKRRLGRSAWKVRRAGDAVADHRLVSQCWLGLAGGRVQPL